MLDPPYRLHLIMYSGLAQMDSLRIWGSPHPHFGEMITMHKWQQAPQIPSPFSSTLGVRQIIETMFGCFPGNKSSGTGRVHSV